MKYLLILLLLVNVSYAKESSTRDVVKTSDERLGAVAEDHERNEARDRERAAEVARHACEIGCGALAGGAGASRAGSGGAAGAVIGAAGVVCAVGCNRH